MSTKKNALNKVFDYHARQKDYSEMLKIIEKAQRLLAIFLNVTDDCPRCLQKLEESLQ